MNFREQIQLRCSWFIVGQKVHCILMDFAPVSHFLNGFGDNGVMFISKIYFLFAVKCLVTELVVAFINIIHSVLKDDR